MNEFKCERCGAPMRASTLYVQRNWPVPCKKCGATHHASGAVISPPMIPVNDVVGFGALSPWQFHYTRPLKPGAYHCRFRDVDQEFIVLWWNGRYFQPSAVDTRPVQMATLLSWRGVWAR